MRVKGMSSVYAASRQAMKSQILQMQKLGVLKAKKSYSFQLKFQTLQQSVSKYDFIFFDKELTIIDKVSYKNGPEIQYVKNLVDVQEMTERGLLNKWTKMEQLFSNKRALKKLQTFENDSQIFFQPRNKQSTETSF